MDVERLRELYESIAIAGLERTVARDARHYESNIAFAKQRFQEGVELAVSFHDKYNARPLHILDLGAGTGGVSAALAAEGKHRVVAVDIVANEDLRKLRNGAPALAGLSRALAGEGPAEAGAPFHVDQVIATADALPFANESFDVVLCLETIEHLPNPRASAREMMRVLRTGGQVMITTPARLRFLWKPDPHYQVRGLAALPDSMQRKVIVEKLKLTDQYDVQHLFWTAGGMIRMFPNRGRVETLVAIPWPGRPRNLKEILWKVFRRLLWDRIVIYKR
jgi:SAM-dependent methyltransferase